MLKALAMMKSEINNFTRTIKITPHDHSKPQLGGVEQAVLICFSYLCDNMHDQRPNKHRQQHHAREIQHYEDLFEYHNAVPAKRIYWSVLVLQYRDFLLQGFYLSNS